MSKKAGSPRIYKSYRVITSRKRFGSFYTFQLEKFMNDPDTYCSVQFHALSGRYEYYHIILFWTNNMLLPLCWKSPSYIPRKMRGPVWLYIWNREPGKDSMTFVDFNYSKLYFIALLDLQYRILRMDFQLHRWQRVCCTWGCKKATREICFNL